MKGQTTFELVITLSIVAILVSVILSDASDESLTSAVMVGVKDSAAQKLALLALSDPRCAGSYVSNISLSGSDITVNVVGCVLDKEPIADAVEKNICFARPNGNAVIDCATPYNLNVIS
jgi:hypothetical protein